MVLYNCKSILYFYHKIYYIKLYYKKKCKKNSFYTSTQRRHPLSARLKFIWPNNIKCSELLQVFPAVFVESSEHSVQTLKQKRETEKQDRERDNSIEEWRLTLLKKTSILLCFGCWSQAWDVSMPPVFFTPFGWWTEWLCWSAIINQHGNSY